MRAAWHITGATRCRSSSVLECDLEWLTCRAPKLDITEEAIDGITTALTNRTSGRQQRDKYTRCPVSDLDLSGCERCTTSYVRLPADYPALTFTARCAYLLPPTATVQHGHDIISCLLILRPHRQITTGKCVTLDVPWMFIGHGAVLLPIMVSG